MWLTSGYLYPETEGFITAIQDGAIRTRNYEKHILKLSHEDSCRRCKGAGETIEHISAECPALAETEYLGRHSEVCKIIHQQLVHKYNLCKDSSDSTPYYKYQPAPVLESPNALLYWDRPILTDKTVDYNRPDIVLIDKVNAEGIIVDIAIPLRHNVRKTEEQKVSKYQNVACELQRMWKLKKVIIIPLVIATDGIMSNNLRNIIKKLGLPAYLIRLMQKATLLQTAHIVRKFLNFGG
nr:unnamed protein product [Callosobruchus analis]CAI5855886.1 unnamed protein product [Callosobruchus analis]